MIALDSVRPVDLVIERQVIPAGNSNRPGDPLFPTGDLWETQHTTGNTAIGATAQMHATFVAQGGGKDNVSFHGTVDDIKAIQLLPLDEVAYHASDGCDDYENDLGCWHSIAVELCVNKADDPEAWARAKANAAAFMAAICSGDKRLDYGRTDFRRFSPKRIRPHRRWAYDLKWCPTQLFNDGSMDPWTGEGPFMDAVVKLAGTKVVAYAAPQPTPLWTGRAVRVGPNTWHPVKRKITTLRKTTPLAYFGKTAKATAADVPANHELDAAWEVVNTKTGMPVCWVTIHGSRIDANHVRERVLFSENKAA